MRLKFRNKASRLLLAAVLFGPGSAAAQDYPSGTEAAVLSGWLSENTNIAPAAVVSVTPELVVALVGRTTPTTTGGPMRLTLREEVIAPSYVEAVGGRSSLMSMEIHCEERRIRMDERRLYSDLNLTGAVETSDPSAEWVRIPEGSIMDEVARAACDTEFPWPLRFAEARRAASGTAQPSASELAAVEITPAPATKNAAPPPSPAFAVQIGAYETREMAEDAWAKLSASRRILVDGIPFEIQPVRVKGKDWLRGLVGRFATREEADAFCTAIAGAEYGCILRILAD